MLTKKKKTGCQDTRILCIMLYKKNEHERERDDDGWMDGKPKKVKGGSNELWVEAGSVILAVVVLKGGRDTCIPHTMIDHEDQSHPPMRFLMQGSQGLPLFKEGEVREIKLRFERKDPNMLRISAVSEARKEVAG